jgi:hypothetical protein
MRWRCGQLFFVGHQSEAEEEAEEEEEEEKEAEEDA